MAAPAAKRRPARTPAAVDLDAALAGVAAMTIDELRDLWRQQHSQEPPPAFFKDLIARALAYRLQEEVLGGLKPRLRKLLAASSRGDAPPPRQVKVGSVIVREYQGELHEVLVVPDGFCWRGEVFASLSFIARKITGTSWNGPRFFGLRGRVEEAAADAVVPAKTTTDPRSVPRSVSVQARPLAKQRGGAA
jgi:hypothetical protein